MKITYLVLGPFMTNTYIVYNEDTMEAIILIRRLRLKILFMQLKS